MVLKTRSGFLPITKICRYLFLYICSLKSLLTNIALLVFNTKKTDKCTIFYNLKFDDEILKLIEIFIYN